MHKIYYLLLSIVVVGINKTQGSSYNLEKAERKKIEAVVDEYTNNLTKFSKCGDNCSVQSSTQANLLALFEDTKIPHAFDLYNKETDELSASYFRIIEEDYHNDIKMEFKKPNILDCTQMCDSIRFGLVMIDKELSYKGEIKKVSLLIGINLSQEPYKINKVEYPEEYKENNGSCSLEGSSNKNNKKDYKEYIAAADKEYDSQNYPVAWQLYRKASYFSDQDQYALARMQACDRSIKTNPEYYSSLAESYYNQGDYNKAKGVYITLGRLYPERLSTLSAKIRNCNNNIDSKYYVRSSNLGEAYYKEHSYSKAKYEYEKALIYHPGDAELQKKIRECQTSSPQPVQIPTISHNEPPSTNHFSAKPGVNQSQEVNTPIQPNRNATPPAWQNVSPKPAQNQYQQVTPARSSTIQSEQINTSPQRMDDAFQNQSAKPTTITRTRQITPPTYNNAQPQQTNKTIQREQSSPSYSRPSQQTRNNTPVYNSTQPQQTNKTIQREQSSPSYSRPSQQTRNNAPAYNSTQPQQTNKTIQREQSSPSYSRPSQQTRNNAPAYNSTQPQQPNAPAPTQQVSPSVQRTNTPVQPSNTQDLQSQPTVIQRQK